jgi:hypothetical protein
MRPPPLDPDEQSQCSLPIIPGDGAMCLVPGPVCSLGRQGAGGKQSCRPCAGWQSRIGRQQVRDDGRHLIAKLGDREISSLGTCLGDRSIADLTAGSHEMSQSMDIGSYTQSRMSNVPSPFAAFDRRWAEDRNIRCVSCSTYKQCLTTRPWYMPMLFCIRHADF